MSSGRSVNLGKIILKCDSDDKSIKNYLYTDGIGKISLDLIHRIQNDLQVSGTVFQIRYLGCKGLLVLNRFLKSKTIIVRDSMQKFQCNHKDADKYFDLLDYNYYKPGYLNRQILILLSANGVNNKGLFEIQ